MSYFLHDSRQVLISRAAMAAQESLFQTLGKLIAQRINFSEPSGEREEKEGIGRRARVRRGRAAKLWSHRDEREEHVSVNLNYLIVKLHFPQDSPRISPRFLETKLLVVH